MGLQWTEQGMAGGWVRACAGGGIAPIDESVSGRSNRGYSVPSTNASKQSRPRQHARDLRPRAAQAAACQPRASAPSNETAQGWPKLWANFKALVGICSQSVGPSPAIWANPVQFSFTMRGWKHGLQRALVARRTDRPRRPRAAMCGEARVQNLKFTGLNQNPGQL